MKLRAKILIALGILSAAIISNPLIAHAEENENENEVEEISISLENEEPKEKIEEEEIEETQLSIEEDVLPTEESPQYEEVPEMDEPTKPIIEGELTNEKINQYNSEVVDYNNQVDEYNEYVDDRYEIEKRNTEKANEEIEKENEAELAKVTEVEEENNHRQEEYDKEYAQYEKDKKVEEQILNLGFESVEQYNEYINTNYNEPANKSVEENSNEEATFSIEESYTIEELPIKIDYPIKVHVEHNFDEVDLHYSEDFEIDALDSITFYAAGAQLTPTQPNYSSFYMYTDEDHVMGYWTLTDSTLLSLANSVTNGWQNGDTHTVTYREGARYCGVLDLDMTYNYAWIPLKTYKTYDTPKEPTLELLEYTPDLKEKLKDPIKLTYLPYLDFLPLLEDNHPPVTPPPAEEETPPPAIQEEIIEIPQVEQVITPVIEQKNIQPRMAETSDSKELKKRYSIIIGCGALLGLLLISYIPKKKK